MTSHSVATQPTYAAYIERRDKLIRELREAGPTQSIGLNKSTSNLFRARAENAKRRIDVRDFNHVLKVDADALVAEVEGMTTYEDLVDATLKYDLLPTVVPQLKTITIGGAVSGLGIESSSFKYGLVHETVLEMEIVLAEGSTLLCSQKQNKSCSTDFLILWNSRLILKLKVKLLPAKKYVKLTHHRFAEPQNLFEQLAAICSSSHFDFVDGAVSARTRHTSSPAPPTAPFYRTTPTGRSSINRFGSGRSTT